MNAVRSFWLLGAFILLPRLAAPAEGDDLRQAFSAWAQAVEIHSFACQYRSAMEGPTPPEGASDAVTGEWRISLRPSPRQFLSFQLPDQSGECQWDSTTGEGRLWARSEGSVQATGTLLAVPPKNLGYCEYPSDLFFLINDGRPIRRHLEMVDFEARRLDGSKAVFFLKHKEKSHVLAYFLDLSEAQPVFELRLYLPLYEGPPLRNKTLGDDLELPQDVKGAVCYSRKRVLASAVQSGKQIPIRWTIEHALLPPGSHYVVSLDPMTLRVDEPLTDDELTARWPEGTEVFDTVSGASFSAVGETRVEAKVISEAMLESMAGEAGLGTRPEADARPAVSGCGANVLYIALRMLGKEPRLNDLCGRLGIEVNQQLSSLAAIVETSGALGCPALAVKGGKALLRPAAREPEILHVRKVVQGKDTGDLHYILVDDYDRETDTLRVIDPPFKAARSHRADVQALWTGMAVVFSGTSPHTVATTPAWRSPLVIALAVFAAAGIAFLAAARAKRGRQLAPGTLLPLFLLVAGLGCRPAANGELVGVNGEPAVDFGRVQRSSANLSHRFEIENRSGQPVSIQDIRSTCSCVSATAESRSLAPGQRTGVRLELDTKLVVGRRKATALLVLDRGDPVVLSVEAFVESSYNVALSPGVWTLPADLQPGSTIQRTLRVTEFLPTETDASESTAIEPEEASVKIVERTPWRCQGFNARGYVRERELVMTYAAPATVVPRNWTISFKFSRPGEKPDGPRTEAFAQVLMNQL